MNRTLVDQALALAQKYEAEGNQEKKDYFMKVAEEADAMYTRIEVEAKQKEQLKGGQ